MRFLIFHFHVIRQLSPLRVTVKFIVEVFLWLPSWPFSRSPSLYFSMLYKIRSAEAVSSRWKSILCLLQKKGNIYFVHQAITDNTQKKTSCTVNSKRFVNIISRALQNIEGWLTHKSLFGAKICSYICPWTLPVPWCSQFSSSFAFRKLFVAWNR